jgi:flagellar motor switch protein FliM
VNDNPGTLSQNEIDALLQALSSGGAAETKEAALTSSDSAVNTAKRYDFRRPDRFSKEQMRALRMIHETWARRVSVSLSAHLRTSVEVTLADIDQGIYTTLAQQFSEGGLYYIIGLVPLAGHFVLHVNAEMSMVIVDRLMGGAGTTFNPDRRPTDLEVELLRGIADKLLADLQEAWASAAIIRPRIDDVSVNLLVIPIALPTDAIVWASFEVRIRGNASGMVLGLPYPVLKPIAQQLSPYTWTANAIAAVSGESNERREDVQGHLARLKLPVQVFLGSAELSLEELACIQPGDVLPLDVPTDALCPIMVNGYRKFMGRVGLRRRKMAIQVERIVGELAAPDMLGRRQARRENR